MGLDRRLARNLFWQLLRWYAVLMICLLVLLSVAAIAVAWIGLNREAHLADCISSWATASTVRSETVATANAQRLNGLDMLVRSVGDHNPQEFERDLKAYIVISNAYNQTLRLHPVPPPPAESCR